MKRKILIWIPIIAAATLLGIVIGKMLENLPQGEKRAKYIFLFIGDGMGNAHVSTAESYLSYKAGKLGGERLLFSSFPYCGTATTFSADRNVTCSSAAGTAIACGEKANNGTVGINKDSIEIESIAYALQKDGYKIGILSTVPVNHATPASFYAHSLKRSNYYEISRQIPESGFEFFAGAGFLDYKGKKEDKEATDLYLERNGYTVSYGIEEFLNESADAEKVVFCQASNRNKSAKNYVSYNVEVGNADMAQMLRLGLDFLGDKEPFFFMCEGGAIDWAAHFNRTMSMVDNILDFEAAVKVAYQFYMEHPEETLIVVTADHETGGLSLGAASKTIDWETLEKQWVESGRKDVLDNEENTKLNESCSIGWTTTGHTGGAVPVYAIGVGAERLNGHIDNTEIRGRILGK